MKNYIDKILKSNVYDIAKETPLEYLSLISSRLNNAIYLKREDTQPVFSFKLRGAYNKISTLTNDQLKSGIIAASAGNHAQGVALAAKKLSISATIVMPKTTPSIKVANVKRLGAKVILFGDNYDQALEHSLEIADREKLTFIHPYDDPEVIAGQGTIAMEIAKQHPSHIDAIFVAVGGGGLIAGIAAYYKQLFPNTKIYGVEPENSNCLYQALQKNKRVTLKEVGIFADGVAVKQIGKEPFRIAKEFVDDVILVSTDEICASIKEIYDNTRSIAEPAGALGLAGLKKYIKTNDVSNKELVTINCGANINFDRLRHISERADVGQMKEALFAVKIPEKPGAFKRFCKLIGKRSITEFNYRYSNNEQANIFVGVELSEGLTEKSVLIELIRDNHYEIVDLTDDEMTKLHIRHMVGGNNNIKDEQLYRFQFPERPGALIDFLTKLGTTYNITLFHYRNHGAAFGRVLAGIQIEKNETKAFNELIKSIGFRYSNETDNPAYKLFLSNHCQI